MFHASDHPLGNKVVWLRPVTHGPDQARRKCVGARLTAELDRPLASVPIFHHHFGSSAAGVFLLEREWGCGRGCRAANSVTKIKLLNRAGIVPNHALSLRDFRQLRVWP